MEIIIPDNIIKGTLSVKKIKEDKYLKCTLKLIKLKNKETYQISFFTDKQVFHENVECSDIKEYLNNIFTTKFMNMELFTNDKIYSYRITSKGKILTNSKKNNLLIEIENHNNKKNYLLPEGIFVPPLVDLGILTKDGKVIQSSYDKYKQINRFIEIIDDSIKNEKKLKIIDFGCGKSYLTFILYFYLTEIKKIECEIIGLDLKEEVIDFCNNLVKKYNYSGIRFLKGDIASFDTKSNVDMIITLHACDTATDYALYHAIKMKCKYIFSVPCCQHEINQQLKTDKLHLITKFGILKERFSAILTDSIRANILQYYGYKTQVMEFVDFENSPKNLLIRAEYTQSKNSNALVEVKELINSFEIRHTLYELLFSEE